MSDSQPRAEDSVAAEADPAERANAALAQLAPGLVIDNKYRVDRVLGRGAMGVVVSATHLVLDEPVALKFLSIKGGAGDNAASFVARFEREARVTARLRNEHIARVTDVGLWQSAAMYMVMEMLEGVELAAILKETPRLDLDVAVDFTLQLCTGLAEAHGQGIVHRDLKPSNLFVVPRSDGTKLIKILDFGISKWEEDSSEGDDELTAAGTILGTPKYMAPEQLFGAQTVDARADVFSIGAILFAMLTGRPPFVASSFVALCTELAKGAKPPRLRELRPDLSAELENVVAHALDMERESRTSSVADLAYELALATGASDADDVRMRLSVALGSTERAEGLGLARTGQGPSLRGSMAFTRSAEVPTVPAPAAEPPRKSKTPYAVLALLLLGGIVAAVALRPAPRAEAGSAPAAAAPPPPSAAPSPVSTVAAAPPPTVVAAPPPASTVAAATPPPPTYKGGPAPKAKAKAAEPPPPVAVVTAAPPPPPPPPAAPTAKPNPLEDRQ